MIHYREDTLKTTQMVFEARYVDGVRLVDRMGAIACRLTKADPKIKLQGGNTLVGMSLKHAVYGIDINILVPKFDVSISSTIGPADAEDCSPPFRRNCRVMLYLMR